MFNLAERIYSKRAELEKNHEKEMEELEKAINSLKKTQNSESSGTKKNQSRLKACNDLLASL